MRHKVDILLRHYVTLGATILFFCTQSVAGQAVSPLPAATFDRILSSGVDWTKITALTDSQARELGRFSGVTIDEDFLRRFVPIESDSVDEDMQNLQNALAGLRGSRGVLPLVALECLTSTQAKALASFRGHTILLWGLRTLTGKLNGANNNVATALAGFRGDWNYAALDLRGLEALSPSVARSLSHFRGDRLNLDGLKRLDSPSALALGQSMCAELSLNGLKRLTLEQAQALGAFVGERLELNGLQDITTLQARALAGFSGAWVSLSGIHMTDDAVIAELASFGGRALDLSGLRYLSDGQAKSLASYAGARLNLSGLRALTDTQAEALGGAVCREMFLDGLTHITETQLRALSHFTGKTLSLGSWNQFDTGPLEEFRGANLYLTGLTELTQKTVNSILKCQARMVWLDAGVIVSDKNFALLSQTGSVGLVLSQITSLKRVPLQLLMTWSGGLEFNHVTELDARLMPALAAWQGRSLRLDGLRELRPGDAQALSEFRCAELSLSNLRGLTADDVQSLYRFAGTPLDVSGWNEISRRLYFQRRFAEQK